MACDIKARLGREFRKHVGPKGAEKLPVFELLVQKINLEQLNRVPDFNDYSTLADFIKALTAETACGINPRRVHFVQEGEYEDTYYDLYTFRYETPAEYHERLAKLLKIAKKKKSSAAKLKKLRVQSRLAPLSRERD
jgi:hypothetical protein